MQFINQKIRWLKFLILIPFFFSLDAFAESKNILVLGDSLSAEYELEPGTGWVSLLEKRLAKEHPGYTVVNASLAGETTASGSEHFPRLLKEHAPEIVIIELGGNDALRHISTAIIEKNLRIMIRKAMLAHSKVVVLGMRLPSEHGEVYARHFSNIYRQITNETNTELVPDFLEGINRKKLDDFNKIHFSKEAQFILLDNVWPHLLPLLE